MIKNKNNYDLLGQVGKLYQYWSLGHSITIDNGLTKLELFMKTMNDYSVIMSKNLTYPDIGPMVYDEMLTPSSLIAIILQLKEQPSTLGGENKWEDICLSTITIQR